MNRHQSFNVLLVNKLSGWLTRVAQFFSSVGVAFPVLRRRFSCHLFARDVRDDYRQQLQKFHQFRQQSKLSSPRCFVSHARGKAAHTTWTQQFVTDLRAVNVDVLWDDPALDTETNTASIARLENRDDVGFIIVVGTPHYVEKYNNPKQAEGSAAVVEVDFIYQRRTSAYLSDRNSLLPVLLNADEDEALPSILRGRIYADFRDVSRYFVMVFDLALRMYGLSPHDEAIGQIREELRKLTPDMGE